MLIQIATRHGHLSEASQDKIRERVERLTRYFDRLLSIEVIVDLKDSENPEIDLMVTAEHKHDFVARNKSESMFGSVDAVVQKMEQQLRKYKERVQGRHRKGESRRPEIPEEPVEE
ncbi:MAG: ribosome-associated translation inhibitor RaiA [Pirellulales bacterium]|nr:ribosome-associated translation inhibitor RaiA [Pirellulales bacterium]